MSKDEETPEVKPYTKEDGMRDAAISYTLTRLVDVYVNAVEDVQQQPISPVRRIAIRKELAPIASEIANLCMITGIELLNNQVAHKITSLKKDVTEIMRLAEMLRDIGGRSHGA